ncbi:uncharacterized protein LOC131200581 [Ahaetulla prasina]|uniref:uncharacterized protein LOC131200581 n=1 Tax=Ahaetulla prasina TaxID=499056 RepID=UPI002647207B|nr:uncharacterized protein LOC131200581 [Ahaetulla prasina]
MAALGTLYPNSPSTDSAAPLSSTTDEKVSPPPYESSSVSVAASAPPADTALSPSAASPPPPEDTDIAAGTLSALVALSSLSLRTEPPISAYPLNLNPAGGGQPIHENINVRVLKNLKAVPSVPMPAHSFPSSSLSPHSEPSKHIELESVLYQIPVSSIPVWRAMVVISQKSLPAKSHSNQSQETGIPDKNILLFVTSRLSLMELAMLFKADLSNISALQLCGPQFLHFSVMLILAGEFLKMKVKHLERNQECGILLWLEGYHWGLMLGF